jgi:hypothetical protein
MPRLAALATSLLIGAVAAACGSGNGATTAPGGSTAAATPGAPGGLTTPVPVTQAPLPTLDPGFSFTLPSADKELEDQLPDTIAGVTVSKSSMAGDALVGSDNTDMSKVLQQLNKTPEDFSAAFGSGGGVTVSAYRLKGVNAGTLLTAFVQLLSADEVPQISDASLGGKAVKRVISSGDTTYVYTSGDILFTIAPIGSGKDAAVADAISQLP